MRPRQDGRHFADDILKCIFLNENARIWLKISLKFVPKVRINNITALVQIMAWRRPGDKPLSEPMMTRLPTHICVTRHQWVKCNIWSYSINDSCQYTAKLCCYYLRIYVMTIALHVRYVSWGANNFWRLAMNCFLWWTSLAALRLIIREVMLHAGTLHTIARYYRTS